MLVYWNTTNVKFHYRTAQYETRTLGGVRGAVRFYLGADPSTRLNESSLPVGSLSIAKYNISYIYGTLKINGYV